MALKALFYPDVPFDSLFIPYIYKEIYLEGIYIDIFNTRKDLVVVDVGANIGCVTQYMRDHAKVVYAIEPSTEHHEALKKNVEFNEWTNVVPINAAIADKDGEMTLKLNPYNRTCHHLEWDGVSKDTLPGETVKTISFETLIKEHNIEKIDFVKFDVEGAEELILMGESFGKVADKIMAIEVEFHFPSFPKIVEHMLKLGYKARRYDSSAVVILFSR